MNRNLRTGLLFGVPPLIMLGLAFASKPQGGRKSELLSRAETEALGVIWQGNSSNSHDLLEAPADGYPDAFT